MEVNKSVVAAITTALHYYFEMEQQQTAAPVEVKEQVREIPGPTFSPWVMSGRQATMEMRRYWQMRLVR